MRKLFQQFFRPSDDELRQLWEDGLFCFDASVLLNVYGYSSDTRDQLVRFIESNAARVCLPYQFGLEYARDRSTVIIKQVNRYRRVEDDLKKIEG